MCGSVEYTKLQTKIIKSSQIECIKPSMHDHKRLIHKPELCENKSTVCLKYSPIKTTSSSSSKTGLLFILLRSFQIIKGHKHPSKAIIREAHTLTYLRMQNTMKTISHHARFNWRKTHQIISCSRNQTRGDNGTVACFTRTTLKIFPQNFFLVEFL